MTRKFRVDSVKKSSMTYFPGMENYVGNILILNADATEHEGVIGLFTRDAIEWCYFDFDCLTEIFNVVDNKPEVEKKSALDVQEGGGHYKSKGIQPVEYAYRNNLGFIESNVVKYVSRWKEKNGIQDLKKARHYLDILIEFEEQKEHK